MEDLKLIKKAIRGNPGAYGELIHMHQEYLYRTAFLHVKNKQLALDMVSECILKGYESIHKLKEPQYFKTWLTRILINVIRDYYRSHIEYTGYEGLEQEKAVVSGVSPEEKWDLYEAVDSLPDKYKTVIILMYFDNLKIREIAYILDIPEGSVKAYLHKGKEQLKNYLREDYLYV